MSNMRKYYDAHLREHFTGKTALITGGFGFIGSQVAFRLLKAGAKVSVLDIDTSLTRLSLINDPQLNIRNSIELHEGSITDFDFLQEVFSAQRYDYVFNMAAYASTVEKAVEEPLATYAGNSLGVITLLEAVRAASNIPEMFFHASTDKVYGELSGDAYDEADPLAAEGLYDTAKMAADVFVRSYSRVFQIPTVVLRMCNIFGPYDLNIGSRLLPKSLYSMFGETTPQAPTLYLGSQLHSRDYLYIDDLVYSILLLTAEPSCQGKAFNSVSCAHKTTPEMLQHLFDSALEEASEFDPKRAGEIKKNGIRKQDAAKSDQVVTIMRQHLKSERITNAIGFKPMVSLEDGLQKTARFYREYFNVPGSKLEEADLAEEAEA